MSEGGTQFISHNGTIAGHFEQPPSAPSNCSTYFFDSLKNSIVQVGVNPPWDTNPFYFNIEHSGETLNTSDSDASFCISLGGCTYDSIYNLFFATADYLCMADDGSQCGVIEWDYYFVPVEMVNLNKAATVQFDRGDSNEKGYSIIGNQSTFASNKTTNSFDFQRPSNYTYQQGCADELYFEWNSTTPFTYALNFINTSAEALFSLTAPYGTVTFLYSGTRVDDTQNQGNSQVDPDNMGNYTPIALNTSDPLKPNFTFANGSEIIWKNYSNVWGAIASSSAPCLEIQNLGMRLKSLLMMVVAGCFTLL